jgi:hypothetical protein
VCDQDRHGLLIIDLRTIFKLYFASPLSSEAFNNDTSSAIINGLAAVVYFCGGDNHFASPRGIVVDDTSSELYVSDQMNHRVQVYTFSPVALAELKIQHWSTSTAKLPLPNKRGGNAPVVLTRSFGVKGHGEGQLQRPGGVDVSHYHVVVCDVGNNRLAVFTKRGAFVTNYGSKGTGEAQFHDIRDVKLLNVKKVRFSESLCCRSRVFITQQSRVFLLPSVRLSGDLWTRAPRLGTNNST